MAAKKTTTAAKKPAEKKAPKAPAEKKDEVKYIGNPKAWLLLNQSIDGDVVKTTEAMNLPEGCLVQTTRVSKAGETVALTYVPNVQTTADTNSGRRLIATL